ncbi:hypothetical protein I656_01877 [Geobacillus sp. WSUCF1]|nr:hypothetical protein I656_01877 [Geobacillus sp. WSUCF1]
MAFVLSLRPKRRQSFHFILYCEVDTVAAASNQQSV